MFFKLLVLLQIVVILYVNAQKKPRPYVQTEPHVKYSNPNYIHDRKKKLISKPHMPDSWKYRHRKPYESAWMDYCDPHHCNDYYKIACGLNRNTMRFKWFQSQCHLIINNMCSTYRGALKYDVVDVKFCKMYVMELRSACPNSCDPAVAPVCAVSSTLDRAVLFRNRCVLGMINCKASTEGLDEYEEVHMFICDYYLRNGHLLDE